MINNIISSAPGDGAEEAPDTSLVARHEGGGVDDPSVVLVKLTLDQRAQAPGQLLETDRY